MVFVLGWFTDQSAWIINGTFSCPLVSDLQSVCEQAVLTWPKRLVCIDMYVKKLNLNKIPYMEPLTGLMLSLINFKLAHAGTFN